jgi:hypothetical protein
MEEITNNPGQSAGAPEAITWTLPLVQVVTQTTEITAVPQKPHPEELVTAPQQQDGAIH